MVRSACSRTRSIPRTRSGSSDHSCFKRPNSRVGVLQVHAPGLSKCRGHAVKAGGEPCRRARAACAALHERHPDMGRDVAIGSPRRASTGSGRSPGPTSSARQRSGAARPASASPPPSGSRPTSSTRSSRARRSGRASSTTRAGAVEREFGRLKHEWALLPLRVRGLERVRLHADLTILAKLSCALARARAVSLAA